MSALRPSQVPGISLAEASRGLGLSGEVPNAQLVGVRLNSRLIKPGELYVALPGTRTHGARFAAQAAELGAVAVLTDAVGAPLAADCGVPVLVSERLRADAATISARVFGRPGDRLELFAVTGTNGKTTTVVLLEAALVAAGRHVATIGTLGFRFQGGMLETDRSTVTTPDSPDLQGLLAHMEELGADSVALEVSSHAMALARVDALRFKVGAFLNLGRDHLDFHHSIEEYFEAKAALFTVERLGAAVVWIDDAAGARVAERCRAQSIPLVTVGTTKGCDVRIEDFEPVPPLGGRARLHTSKDRHEVRLAMPGWHNMVDAAVAFAMATSAGVPAAVALTGLETAQVPGRMQVLELPSSAPTVVVDFAHTPQAVAATLDALQEFPKVVAVLGCGGDRDSQKRALMGRAAAERSDLLVITDDNPRTEDPAAIRAEVLSGSFGQKADVIEVADRRDAIQFALANGGSGNVVALLGKGHERGQLIGDQVLPFDDAVVAQEAWRRLEGSDR